MNRIIVIALAAVIAGCSGAMQANTAATATRFERGLGMASARDVMDKTSKVIRQHQFEVFRSENPPNLYLETHWRTRAPFEDEEKLGVTSAQTRVIMRAQQRTTSSLADFYSVDLTIENRVQRMGGGDTWDSSLATPQYVEYANRITQDLKDELNIGVRR
jgi:hypothetical protein